MGFWSPTSKSFRVQATLIALLYLFLATFGTLTHSHAAPDASTSVSKVSGESVVHGHTPTTHCAICDWQANSVSPALTLRFCLGLTSKRVSHPLVVFSAPQSTITYSSSRAPPFV